MWFPWAEAVSQREEDIPQTDEAEEYIRRRSSRSTDQPFFRPADDRHPEAEILRRAAQPTMSRPADYSRVTLAVLTKVELATFGSLDLTLFSNSGTPSLSRLI